MTNRVIALINSLPAAPYVALGFAVLFVGALFVCLYSLGFARQARAAKKRADLLLEFIQPTKGLEKNAEYLLECVGQLLDSPVYAFYVFDAKNQQYLLKAVRHSETDFGKIRPSYSGLTPYKKEAYMPPISLAVSSLPGQPGFVEEGEVPLYLVPLATYGAFRIGPIRKIPRKARKMVAGLAQQIQSLLPELIRVEEMRNQVDVVVASGKALQNISNVAVDPKVTLEMMLDASMRALGASQVILLQQADNRFGVSTTIGVQQRLLTELLQDTDTLQWMSSLARQTGAAIVKMGDAEFYRLPPYLAGTGAQALAAVQIAGRGTIIYLLNQVQVDYEFGVRQLSLIAEDLQRIIESQAPLQHLSKVYVNILKQLAQMIDNLNPYTVGYSEMMSRYSIAIGKQLGMPDEEIRDVALAAYLSNIGVLGLSNDLYQKEGKFTEAEYEMMKLHAEVGASMVSVTTGNKRVASYIMYHHERIDGAGYPAGLRGADIPLGARIIGVVQTFLAKINGRKGRDPLSFDKALDMLQSAAGTQLDKQVVQAFVAWFESKQKNPAFSERSLGYCWEMCCTPSSICEHCPVYRQSGAAFKNCWEHEGNLCHSHGKSCSSCFVRTEFVTRGAVKRRA